MFFALGACVAGLLALLFLPAVSRRALRLAREDVERRTPLSVEEIVAQRDLLRAEFAVERRRLEQAVEGAQAVHARDLVEAGRATARIAGLEGELARVATARDEWRAEAERFQGLYHEAAGEHFALSKALHDALAAEDDYRERERVATAEAEAATRDLGDARAHVAALQTALADASAGRERFERDLMQARLDLSVAQTQAERLGAEAELREESLRAALASASDARLATSSATSPAAPTERNGAEAAPDFELLRRTIVEIGQEVVRLAEANALGASVQSPQGGRPPASVH